MEQLEEIQPRVEMQKGASKTDRSAIHEHELARHQHRTLFLQSLVEAKRFLATVFRWRDAIGDAAHPVIEQGSVNEPRPDVQGFDEILGETAKAPGFIGMHGAGEILVEQSLVKVDDAADEFGGENTDAPIIEEVNAARLLVVSHAEHRIISKARTAVDDADPAERNPPGLEHRLGDAVARGFAGLFEDEQFAAFEPLHTQQPPG